MSRFGWAYVNGLITSSVANGPIYSVQFNSGSNVISGSSNLTFDYTTNTLYLTGTLRADTLVVSSSQILKSGSTIFGDDLLDTHQFTGSVYVTGVVSSSTGIQTAGGITSNSIISSSLGLKTNTTIEAAGNITSQAIISSSNGFQTNSTIDAVGNIRTTNGDVSSSIGLQTGGFLTVSGAATIRGGLTVTGSSYVQALSSSGQIQAASLRGDGLNITGIEGSNVYGVGDDYTIQFKDFTTGALTGSANLLFSSSVLKLSASAIVYPTSTRTGSFTVGSTEYFIFVSGTAVTASFGAADNGRVIRIYNYGLDTVLLNTTGAPVNGFVGSGGTNVATIIQATNPRTIELMYFTTNNRWLTISTGN